MALGASIYKANISISNLNNHFYQDFSLTIAMHPSETETRMMFRLLAFAYCAHDDLGFSKGLSHPEEPDLWQKNLTGDIVHWIDLGLPDEKRIKQAAGRSQKVSIFTYQQNRAEEWLPKIKEKFASNKKINIFHFKVVENGPLEKMVTKNMNLNCTIEDNIMYLGNDDERVGIEVSQT